MSKVNFNENSHAAVFLHHYPRQAQIGLQQVAHRLGKQENPDTVRDGVERRLLGDSQFRRGVVDLYLAVATELHGEMIIDNAERRLRARPFDTGSA
jgi:hypothetical protein